MDVPSRLRSLVSRLREIAPLDNVYAFRDLVDRRMARYLPPNRTVQLIDGGFKSGLGASVTTRAIRGRRETEKVLERLSREAESRGLRVDQARIETFHVIKFRAWQK